MRTRQSTDSWAAVARLSVALSDVGRTFGLDGRIYAMGGYNHTLSLTNLVTAYTPSAASVSSTVSIAWPLSLVVHPIAATAGQAFINVSVATFTYGDQAAPPVDFTAKIIWGDGYESVLDVDQILEAADQRSVAGNPALHHLADKIFREIDGEAKRADL